MTGSQNAKASATATEWRTESRYYRRSPGWGWLLGLLLIPLLFGWLGWGAMKPKVDLPSVSVSAPSVSVPSLNLSPLSILRNGRDFTLTGILPDLATKNSLLSTLKAALGGGVNLIDKIDIEAGAKAPGFDGLAALLKAAGDIGDFRFTVEGGTLTLTGTAPSQDVKDAVEAAAQAGWPNMQIINNITIQGAAPSCDNLQATVDANLAAPIKFQTESAKLTPDAQQQLAGVVSAVKVCPDVKLTVVGHTDNTGTDAINNPLSDDRAKAVAAYLVSQGIPADSVSSQGAGSAEPIADNNTAAGRAQNRRTEIKVN
ncbi:MAG: OmpA family protein [Mycobacterium sp.]|nr:OmpA family protein [Mycobacterium sp.]